LDLAELLVASNLNDEAFRVLEGAISLKTDNPEVLRMSARLCYDRKLYSDARERLELASRKGLPDPKSDLLLSRVHLALGNARRAEYYYSLAVRRDRGLDDPSYLATINPQRRVPVKIGTVSPEKMSFSSETTGLTFNDVGGMDDVKEHMRMNIILPLQKPELFRQYGKRVGGGILMYGPPGCGKTYIARQLAEEGAAGARRRGYNASARIAQANESVAKTIDEVAQEIDAGLVVCGQRGRGAIRSALLGSVSHALAAHAKRPVLIAPEHPS